jgi:hypothetical protein
MAAPALRPRSPSEIVDAAFQILRAHYAQFVMCAALAYAPLLIVRLLVIGDPSRFIDPASPRGVGSGLLWVTVAAGIASWLTLALMSSVLLVCASQAYLGDAVDAGAAVRRALPRLGQVMVAALLRYVLLFVGFLALFVGALYVAARCFAIVPVIVLEGAGIGGAFSRSSALSRGRKWHILGTAGLVAVIYVVLYFGIGIAVSFAGNFVVQTVTTSLVTILVYPVVAITEALLYYDARIRSEGLDIELMTDALAPPPAAGGASL